MVYVVVLYFEAELRNETNGSSSSEQMDIGSVGHHDHGLFIIDDDF